VPNKITTVVAEDLVGEIIIDGVDMGPLPLSIEIKAAGYNKAVIGWGTIEDPACGKSIIVVVGSINEDILTLTGCIIKGIDLPLLKGTRVKLVADCKSGEMTFTFGPISEGLPLSGLTFIFKGEGTISIK
jgi:hypothetical protein